MGNFRKGGKVAEEASKRKPFGPRAEFFSLADQESAIVRFLEDSEEWIVTDQHNFIPTKGPDADATDEQKKKFPKSMGAVCRYDEAYRDEYSDCFICDHMLNDKGKPYRPQPRLWARVVMREQVVGTEQHVAEGKISEDQIGKPVGLRDKEVEEDETNDKGEKTGKTVIRKDVRIVNMPMKNFFGVLQGYFEAYGTVLDRDYKIKRKGQNLDTEYHFVPMDPIPGHDLREAELQERYEGIVDLGKVIDERASDKYFARFFDDRVTSSDTKGEQSGSTPNPAQAGPSEEEDGPSQQERMEAMKARVRGDSSRPAAVGPQNF